MRVTGLLYTLASPQSTQTIGSVLIYVSMLPLPIPGLLLTIRKKLYLYMLPDHLVPSKVSDPSWCVNGSPRRLQP